MKALTIFFIICLPFVINSQTGLVTGTLNDNTGLPLPGVNIIVKGTSNGTQTDFDGNYEIECSVGDTLVFSYVGFDTREQEVTPTREQYYNQVLW